MEITHIEHLGIAVKSIEEALPYYEQVLGLKCYNIEEVADQKVKTAFFMVGQTKIELLEPTSEESAVAKFIENISSYSFCKLFYTFSFKYITSTYSYKIL